MRIIAFYNLKGGVGKTASAVNIAYLAAQSNLRTLLWDLDPQGAASWYLAPDDTKTYTSKKLLKGKVTAADLAVETVHERLTLVPADLSYRKFDTELETLEGSKRVLRHVLDTFSETHSLAILDCPPSLSNLAEQVFSMAHAIFVPILPTHLSIRSYQEVRHFMKSRKLGHKQLYPFFTMVDLHRTLHRNMVEDPPEEIKRLLLTYIPYSSVIEKMGENRAPVGAYAASHAAARAYRSLWQDINTLIL
ncbi:MAG: AAA family ATPase [Pseudomonadota bacterium]|nr:AAA family ATPase [Pseudomonadota bacterium]